MGIALTGGLLVRQARTMFSTPALYLLVARYASAFRKAEESRDFFDHVIRVGN
ncbi:hypothetical protein [Komagataeibacter kakiaceti]|uniref:hypothetical protein n=1 Tax=Komagataeibacter kakiaceti TaxID=943261 RepID=UPI000A73A3A1|nr:hypothetical protein [Komagataeibacter kakiaceti]